MNFKTIAISILSTSILCSCLTPPVAPSVAPGSSITTLDRSISDLQQKAVCYRRLKETISEVSKFDSKWFEYSVDPSEANNWLNNKLQKSLSCTDSTSIEEISSNLLVLAKLENEYRKQKTAYQNQFDKDLKHFNSERSGLEKQYQIELNEYKSRLPNITQECSNLWQKKFKTLELELAIEIITDRIKQSIENKQAVAVVKWRNKLHKTLTQYQKLTNTEYSYVGTCYCKYCDFDKQIEQCKANFISSIPNAKQQFISECESQYKPTPVIAKKPTKDYTYRYGFDELESTLNNSIQIAIDKISSLEEDNLAKIENLAKQSKNRKQQNLPNKLQSNGEFFFIGIETGIGYNKYIEEETNINVSGMSVIGAIKLGITVNDVTTGIGLYGGYMDPLNIEADNVQMDNSITLYSSRPYWFIGYYPTNGFSVFGSIGYEELIAENQMKLYDINMKGLSIGVGAGYTIKAGPLIVTPMLNVSKTYYYYNAYLMSYAPSINLTLPL